MDWIEESKNYIYLKTLCENIDPINEQELIFKARLEWLLEVSREQGQALLNIEQAQNSDTIPLSRINNGPRLRVIKGGKT